MRRTFPVLLAAVLSAALQAETLTGVVYFKEFGNGRNPSGTIELAVGGEVQTFLYSPLLETDFPQKDCHDVGAVLKVNADGPNGRRDAVSTVTCMGLDENAHRPWLLVRDYLDGLPTAVASSEAILPAYRTSKGFQDFAASIQNRDLMLYYARADLGSCVRIATVKAPGHAYLAADCRIELHGEPTTLYFDVVRDVATKKWKIAAIEMRPIKDDFDNRKNREYPWTVK